MEYPISSHESINAALQPLSRRSHELILNNRKNCDDEVLFYREDAGDGYMSDGYRTAVTTAELSGEVGSLPKDTLIKYQTFRIPTELTQDTMKLLVHRRPVATRNLSTITISAPGDLVKTHKRVGTEFTGYFYTDHVAQMIAVEGIARFLNHPLADFVDHDRSLRKVNTALGYISGALAEDHRNFEELTKGLFLEP